MKVVLPIWYFAEDVLYERGLASPTSEREIRYQIFYTIDSIVPTKKDETVVYSAGEVFVCPMEIHIVAATIDTAQMRDKIITHFN